LWLTKSPTPSRVSSQFTTPNSKSNIHCHSATAVSTGVAHAATSPAVTSTRMPLPSRRSSSATRVPRSMVRPTQTAAKATVLATTVQKKLSLRMVR
jgi:hypothetical protein